MATPRAFILRVRDAEAAAGQYRISLHAAEAPEGDPPLAEEPAPVPLTFTDLNDTVRTPGEFLQDFGAKDFHPKYLLKAGSTIFEFLHPPQIRAKLQQLTAATDPMRILLDVRSDSLRPLPFEILRDGFAPLAFDALRPALRFKAGPRVQPVTDWPVRMLVIVGAEAASEAVGGIRELEAIEDAVWNAKQCVHLEQCREPSLELLHTRLSELQPHIIHFVGHGGEDPNSFEPALLLSKQVYWTSTLISTYFTARPAQRRPQLVVINACRTAAGLPLSVEEQTQSWSLETAFLTLGVPAIVAMQGDVGPDGARRFTEKFYTQLFAAAPVDAAMIAGRGGIVESQPKDARQPYYPRLTCGPVVDGLFHFAPPKVPEKVRLSECFSEILSCFVDREESRRHLLAPFFPPHLPPHSPPDRAAAQPPEPPRVWFLKGPSKAGKTWLARWGLFAKACRHPDGVRWIDVVGTKSVGWLELLKIIRANDQVTEGYATSAPRQRLDDADFARFDAAVAEAENARGGAAGEINPEQIDEVFDALIEGLASSVQRRPLTLVLDNLRQKEAALDAVGFRYLCDRLLSKMGDPRLEQLNFFIILPMVDSQSAGQEFEPAATLLDNGWCRTIQLDVTLPVDQFERVTGEYLRRKVPGWQEQKWRDIFKSFIEFKRNNAVNARNWNIAELGSLQEFSRTLAKLA